MPSTFDNVDSVDVVRVDDAGAAETTHELGEDVGRDLTPGEIPEDGEGDARGKDSGEGET